MARVRMKNMRRRESGARKKCVLQGIYEHAVNLFHKQIESKNNKHCLFLLSFDSICLISSQQSYSYSNIDRLFTPVKDVKTAVAKEGDVDVVAQSHLDMEAYFYDCRLRTRILARHPKIG